MKSKKNEMGICPKCGNDYARMEDYEMDVDCLWTKWYCPDCDETWTEYALLKYDGCVVDGITYNKDGEEYK